MSEFSFYENVELTAFGEVFSHVKPIEVLSYFRNRSPFLRDKTIEEYLSEHLSLFVSLPKRNTDETDNSYYDRLFDVLVRENMVKVNAEMH